LVEKPTVTKHYNAQSVTCQYQKVIDSGRHSAGARDTAMPFCRYFPTGSGNYRHIESPKVDAQTVVGSCANVPCRHNVMDKLMDSRWIKIRKRFLPPRLTTA
jgi:hypothetical protein